LVNLLEPLRRLIAVMEVELKTRTQEVEAAAPEQLPVGLGRLTSEILEREVADWNRFQNRRQVASYTGLCPRENSSGHRRFQGAINKHGNRPPARADRVPVAAVRRERAQDARLSLVPLQ
jgi:transposase